jgi:superfamily II DNA/RNA helicase
MFDAEELVRCSSEPWFTSGYAQLERNLLLSRLGMRGAPVSGEVAVKLTRFAQAVIASAATWQYPRSEPGRQLCQLAADIEASLAVSDTKTSADQHLSLFKAMILYELAGLPGASASYATKNGLDIRLREFFSRGQNTLWGSLVADHKSALALLRERPLEANVPFSELIEAGIAEIVQEAGIRIQDHDEKGVEGYLTDLSKLASDFNLAVTGDDLMALARTIGIRSDNSSLNLVTHSSELSHDALRAIHAPVELWPAQISALENGLLDETITSFGFAAPTGTGKTALTRILIADALAQNIGRKVLYICPSRALVHQVSVDLSSSLSGVGLRVMEAGAHLVAHELIPLSDDDVDVVVFTPERADLLLRVQREFLNGVCLIVVDEAHHIEQGSRGVLLEFYLWRLRKLIRPTARIVQLSAVAPNIDELTGWLTTEPNDARSVLVDKRSSLLRVGVLERLKGGAAALKFGEAEPYLLLEGRQLPANAREGLAVLANHLSNSGIVLVLCTSPSSAEKVAQLVADLRETTQDVDDDVSVRLDAWIERELYPESPLRAHYRKRVVFHHAQMPPRVRSGLEDAIRSRKVDVICATTTLAEGVNFPFSTVVVESLVGKSFEISPRALWNIAGRAGRFGVDSEGHCLLFRPELWADKLKQYNLDDYLINSLVEIPPVRSALAHGIERLDSLVESGEISFQSLKSISLSDIKVDGKSTQDAKSIRALINIMRVGYVHASSSKIMSLGAADGPEFQGELLASTQLSARSRDFARALSEQQKRVVREATEGNPEFVEIAARVGWSLEAQQLLHKWLQSRDDWQLEQFGNLVVGGYIRNFDNLGYLIGPLAKHLIAFEGEALGGAFAFIAEKWIRGIPLASFQIERGVSFGKLVGNIYGRMQYLLPWGLYGLGELIRYEAEQRKIVVGEGVSSIAVLAAEGVPNFDALQLVLRLGLERVDATRLSQRYNRRSADIVGWFGATKWTEVEKIVRGSDQRRVDPLLYGIHQRLQPSTPG